MEGVDTTWTGIPDDVRDALSEAFDVHSLVVAASQVVVVAADGTLLWANEAWYAFGRANGVALPSISPGTNYFHAAGEGEVRVWLERATSAVLAQNVVVEQNYDCSSPTQTRAFRMRIFPAPRIGLLFEHTLSRERTHGRRMCPNEVTYRTKFGVILTCSNCRRFRRRRLDAWDWVPAWLETPPSSVSHGLCPVCAAYYYPK
jgi:hypothetical protein